MKTELVKKEKELIHVLIVHFFLSYCMHWYDEDKINTHAYGVFFVCDPELQAWHELLIGLSQMTPLAHFSLMRGLKK